MFQFFKKTISLIILSLFVFGLDLARIKAKIEEIGGLKFKKFPQVVYLNQEQVKKLVLRELNFREVKILSPLGIIKDPKSYIKRKTSLFSGAGIGFFSPSSPGKVFVAKGWPESFQEFALVHELRHYLQWEHFPHLFSSLQGGFLGEDRTNALLAILEGDATWVTIRYFGKKEFLPPEFQEDFLLGMVHFFYSEGYNLVEKEWEKEGIEGVISLLRNPPDNTAFFFKRPYRRINCPCRGRLLSLGMETYRFLLGELAFHLKGDCLCQEGKKLKGILVFDSPENSALAMGEISYKIKRRISEKIIFELEVRDDSSNPGEKGNDP